MQFPTVNQTWETRPLWEGTLMMHRAAPHSQSWEPDYWRKAFLGRLLVGRIEHYVATR